MNPTETKPPAASPHVIHEISGWRRIVAWPLVMLLRLWGMSLRFEMTDEDWRAATKSDIPVSLVLWHNRLFMAAEVFRRFRKKPLVALISASGDGAWLTAFFSHMGMLAARGSSSRMGREAATALVEAQRAGYDLGITPDGPRGPCYEVKPGAVIVSRRTGGALLVLGGEFKSAWRLKSWDRLYIPRPFSTLRFRCEVITADQLADRDRGIALLKERLVALNPDRD